MSIIQSIIKSAIGKLSDALAEEVIFLHGVRNKVQLMESEFRAMQSFLKDADAKQLVDDGVKNWVHDVLYVAYAAEDAIDTFACEIIPLRQGGFAAKLKRYIFIFYELKALHSLGAKIESINVRIDAITRRRQTYDIQSIPQSEAASSTGQRLRELRLSSPDVQEPDFIGFQEELKSLTEHLMNGELRRCVVSLVGMGGLGKTTLAKKAYNHDTIKNHFTTCAWVYVSQQYSARELLLDIGKQCSVSFGERLDGMTTRELRRQISGYLEQRRYFIVLDDLWKSEAWDDLQAAFPDERNGSRILLSTRNKDLALYADIQSQPHELPFLEDDESWQLFYKKAFPTQEISCPPHLEETAKEIVRKCQGLPLAIVVMGGLLSRKAHSEWQKVLKSIRWQFREGQEGISKILLLSYDDLPYSLKPCFLYFGIFPEDAKIPANRLIQMWAAEGFLHERGDETLEEVGEDILMELIARSMIHVAERSISGLIESCRIHDLLRDLAILKAKEDGFLEVSSSGTCKGRRMAAHEHIGSDIDLQSSASHLRCVFLSERGFLRVLKSRQEKLLFKRFKLLKVLNLENVRIRKLPSEIEELVHLRYLCCQTKSMKSLPSSMVSLRNLQTLYLVCDCKENGRLHIPSVVKKMLRRLRHLELFMFGDGLRKHALSHNLLYMLEKEALEASYDETVTLEHCTESSSVSELYFINKIFITNSSSPAKLPPQRPFLTESSFVLSGNLKKLPDLCDLPCNLSTLILDESHLKQDPLPWLEKLENLIRLTIREWAYVGKKMTCSPVGFPRLQFLLLLELEFLEELIVEEGSLPSLLHLSIDSCKELKMIPEGLKHLKNLKKLKIKSMPPEFTTRLQSEIGEDWHKIQHIPSISIS